MPTRVSVFPITFGVALLGLGIAFRYRKSFYSEVWEKQHNNCIEGRIQANQFRVDFAEKLEKERSK